MFTIFVLKALCLLFPDSEAEAPHPLPPIPLITKFSKHNPYGISLYCKMSNIITSIIMSVGAGHDLG